MLFLGSVMPSLPVEYAYLAYLKSKGRVYWEDKPARMPTEERRRLTRKTALWLSGIAAALTLVWVWAKYWV